MTNNPSPQEPVGLDRVHLIKDRVRKHLSRATQDWDSSDEWLRVLCAGLDQQSAIIEKQAGYISELKTALTNFTRLDRALCGDDFITARNILKKLKESQ